MGQKPIEGSNPSLSATKHRSQLTLTPGGDDKDNARPQLLSKAPVAQLDRVPGYEPGGREFESLRARLPLKINDLGLDLSIC